MIKAHKLHQSESYAYLSQEDLKLQLTHLSKKKDSNWITRSSHTENDSNVVHKTSIVIFCVLYKDLENEEEIQTRTLKRFQR